jgi:hypothetical protein
MTVAGLDQPTKEDKTGAAALTSIGATGNTTASR